MIVALMVPAPHPPPERIPIERFGVVPSTMDLARDAALVSAERSNEPLTPRFFLADEQFRGRGTQGRAWSSPPGGLWGTLLWPYHQPLPPRDQAALGLPLGVAVLRTIHAYLPHARLKWPNDILIHGRKVAGVLAELLRPKDRHPVLLVGVGINANNQPPQLSDDARPATSLIRELGTSVDLAASLLPNLLRHLHHALSIPPLDPQTLAYAREHLFGVAEPLEHGTLAGLDDNARPIIHPPPPPTPHSHPRESEPGFPA